MSLSKSKYRLAVVSLFLDKRNGTERMAVAWITRLQDSFEIHLYSQSVEDLDLSNIAEAMTSGNRVGDKRNARDHDR
jgi:hypothetical protein